MTKTSTFVLAALLVAATVAYDAFVGFAVWFTIAFFGAGDLVVPSLGALIFWAMAASPIAITWYCVAKVQAVRRGENPRV